MKGKGRITAIALALTAAAGAWAQTPLTETLMSNRQQGIVNIASLTAHGDTDKLRTALTTSLDSGMTVNEVKEVIVHTYAYCGFPRAIRGLQTLTDILDGRRDIRALPTKVDDSTPEFARQFLDYYDNPSRGQHPRSTGWYSYTSLAPMMNFFPFVQIETISPRPLLFIAGEKAVSRYFSEDAYSKAAEPKELFIVPNATHVDLYDQPEYLKLTLPKLDSFFRQHLK